MTLRDILRQIRLFEGLSDDDLARVCADIDEVDLATGETLFEEGDEGDAAYIVVDGRIEIVKSIGGRDTVLAERGPEDVVGEIALLRAAPRMAAVRALTATRLLRVPRTGIEALLATSPDAVQSLYATLVERMASDGRRLRQFERMAQLGTLTAGVAHELNNPAAAVLRSSEQLTAAIDAVEVATRPGVVDADVLAAVDVLRGKAGTGPVDVMARSQAEDAVEAWVSSQGVDDGWRWSAGVVQTGLSADDLGRELGDLGADRTAAALALLVSTADARRLADDIAAGARRLSDIVAALRSHSHLDRAPVTDVDLHRGIEETLTLLAHHLRGITVTRDLGDDVPSIPGNGGALNQVWTNLLHNAADALRDADVADPHVTIRTRRAGDAVVVEFEDDGPGFPVEVGDRVFDAFFTTKPPGEGTGLGLHISREIVVRDHGGTIEVDSEPGRTVVRVTLPTSRPPT